MQHSNNSKINESINNRVTNLNYTELKMTTYKKEVFTREEVIGILKEAVKRKSINENTETDVLNEDAPTAERHMDRIKHWGNQTTKI